MGMTKRNTAKALLTERSKEARELLAKLSAAIDAHEREGKANPENWGFAGNLGYVNNELGDVLGFLTGGVFHRSRS
jgi:hypothetical protein